MKTRRPHGTGSVFRSGDGRWRGVAQIGYTEGRRIRHTVYARSKAEVEKKLADVIAGHAPAPRQQAAFGRKCQGCQRLFHPLDIWRGRCGGCFPWGQPTGLAGVRHPERPEHYRTIECAECQRPTWTTTDSDACFPCDRARVQAWRRRDERMKAARAIRAHTEAEWLKLCKRYSDNCFYCGAHKPLTRDHFVPISKGGHDGINNIRPACWPCNKAKGDRAAAVFLASR